MVPTTAPCRKPKKKKEFNLANYWGNKLVKNNYSSASKSYLSIRSVTDRCNYVSNIYPVHNTASCNVPYTDFAVNGTSDEAIIVCRIKLDTSHCRTRKAECQLQLISKGISFEAKNIWINKPTKVAMRKNTDAVCGSNFPQADSLVCWCWQ